jgi:hypothetical protein
VTNQATGQVTPLGGAIADNAKSAMRFYDRLARTIIVAGIAAAPALPWSTAPTAAASTRAALAIQSPVAKPDLAVRLAQEQTARPEPDAAAPDNGATPAPPPRAVLYEESSDNPFGARFSGSVAWRTELFTPGPGEAPELAVRADIEIPDRRMIATWTLRRNTDKALPASHTIEITFRLPAKFPGGGVDNVPGVLMKANEDAQGTRLAGMAVKVTTGFFLVGLYEGKVDIESNMQLLKDLDWIDIPVIYNSGRRAILAVQKGPPGDRALADAFAAWAK